MLTFGGRPHLKHNITVAYIQPILRIFFIKVLYNWSFKLFLKQWTWLFRWWTDSGLCKLKCARRRYIEYFFLACAICEDEQYSKFRSGIAKFSAIATYLADTYNTYGTQDQLRQFTNAIKK